ncbi:phosphoribosyltransferase [Arenibacterium sp. CAU 1754]
MIFENRADAGRKLADRLEQMALDNPVVYALPRGGVPVAFEVAEHLHAEMDVVLVRKIGAPGNRELALAAIVEGDPPEMVLNRDVMRMTGADDAYLAAARSEQLDELERRRGLYTGAHPRISPTGRTAIVVDDGLATGATMKAALKALKRQGAARIIVALPVAPLSALPEIEALADDVLCLDPAPQFWGVGAFYRDFHQLSDEETVAFLEKARQRSEGDQDSSGAAEDAGDS